MKNSALFLILATFISCHKSSSDPTPSTNPTCTTYHYASTFQNNSGHELTVIVYLSKFYRQLPPVKTHANIGELWAAYDDPCFSPTQTPTDTVKFLFYNSDSTYVRNYTSIYTHNDTIAYTLQ